MDNDMDVLDKLCMLLGEAISKYSKRRVKHGRKRSQAGRLKGSAKRKYLKTLKQKKRKYATSSTAKRKAKVAAKRYKRTSKAKLTKRQYKGKR